MKIKGKNLIGKVLLIIAITWIVENVLVLLFSSLVPNIKEPSFVHGLFYIILFILISSLSLVIVYNRKNKVIDYRLPLALVLSYLFLGFFDTIMNWYWFDIILRLVAYPVLIYFVVFYFRRYRMGR